MQPVDRHPFSVSAGHLHDWCEVSWRRHSVAKLPQSTLRPRSATRLSPTEMTEPRQSTTVPNTSNTKAVGVELTTRF